MIIVVNQRGKDFINQMKKCGQCNYEHTDAMSFCLQCGRSLAAAPETVFNRSAETVFGRQPSAPANFANIPNVPNVPNVPNARPKSGKKIFLILGGVLSLFGLIVVAGVLIVFFNWKSKSVAVVNQSPTPQPTRGIADRPSPDPRAIVTESPAATPDATPTPMPAFTPPVEPTKKGTFTVYANGGWQLSELDTVPLESFRTTAAGLIDLADLKTGVSTKGLNDAKTKSRRIYAEHPTGALMMRTRYADGKYSNVQPVTAAPSVGSWQNFPDERGRLEFCINDNAPAENGGQFTVTKTSVSVPKAKK